MQLLIYATNTVDFQKLLTTLFHQVKCYVAFIAEIGHDTVLGMTTVYFRRNFTRLKKHEMHYAYYLHDEIGRIYEAYLRNLTHMCYDFLELQKEKKAVGIRQMWAVFQGLFLG